MYVYARDMRGDRVSANVINVWFGSGSNVKTEKAFRLMHAHKNVLQYYFRLFGFV